MTKRDYGQIAAQFEADVLAGTYPVQSFRASVVRHLNDITRSSLQCADVQDFPYCFDPEIGDKACALAEQFAFPKGKKRGKRFHLEPWQVWALRVIFGWVDLEDLPRFRVLNIWLPKGSGKSPLAALIGLITLARGRNIGAKVCCAATTEKQANNVFEPAKEMLRLSPEVEKAAGLIVGEHAIKGIGDNRIFERVSAEKRSADGRVDDCIIVDELHQHADRNLWDVLNANASKVEGSRIVAISTAGTDQSPTAIGWQLYSEARAILDGKQDNPAIFALIAEAPRELDPWQESTWRAANPNYGVSVSKAGFKTMAESARAQPSSQPHFFATRLGWWASASSQWIDLNQWDACAGTVTPSDFRNRTVTVGVDLALTKDLTAKVMVGVSFRPDGKRVYHVSTKGYLPEESPTLEETPDLKQWAEQGYLTLTDGAVMNYSVLRKDIESDVAAYPGAEVCVDQHFAGALIQELQQVGIEPISIPQTWKGQSQPMREIEAALIDKRIIHDGSPLMRWCMGNAVAGTDRNGNLTLNRPPSDAKKIDLAAAFVNAMNRATVATEMPEPYVLKFGVALL